MLSKSSQFMAVALYAIALGVTSGASRFLVKEVRNKCKHQLTEDVSTFRRKRSVFDMRNTFMSEVLKQSPALGLFGVNLEFLKDKYPIPEIQKEYDFIIVGAGPAGSVLANRLTERGDWTVLLIEAGEAENIIIKVPMLVFIGDASEYAWRYSVERNSNSCSAMNNKTCVFTAGKGLGGGTLINYMVYSRGLKRDYDKIAEAGNTGWSHDEVLPYFIKSENANLWDLRDSEDHGKNGLLNVEYLKDRTKYAEAFIEGAQELGQKVQDYNKGQPSFGYVQTNIQNGRRVSAARAFLYPIRDRNNLHILQTSRVTKLHIDHVTKKVRYLEYVRNKKRFKVKARKEIILSAGALNSPKILMLSGVGPKNHLREMNIPLIQDLNVGETLYEHVAFTGLCFTVEDPDVNEFTEVFKIGASTLRWLKDGSGPLSSIIGIEAVGFIKTNISIDQKNSSDIEIMFISQTYSNDVMSALIGLKPEIYNEYYLPIKNRRSFLMIPVLLNPKSKGFLKLKDKNPFHYPKFYKNLFADERDLDTLVAGIRFIIKLSKTQGFKKLGTRLYKAHFPLCKQFVFDSDDYWKCTLKSMAFDFRHQVATCKMGPDSDPDAVVDPELRVRGIKGLRVVDASVFPFPLSGHTTAPVYMLAEKAADLIKSSWKDD